MVCVYILLYFDGKEEKRAQRYRVAINLISHLNKRGENFFKSDSK